MSSVIRLLGRVMLCPKCGAACREGSRYWITHNGACDRCEVALEVDTDLPRVARRNMLYVIPEENS